jgi:LysM repeat protein
MSGHKLLHTVSAGDTLFGLAEVYDTTVPAILALNENLNRNNIIAGVQIVICPGGGYKPSYKKLRLSRIGTGMLFLNILRYHS